MEPAVGFEPTTDGLQNRSSTPELSWLLYAAEVMGQRPFYGKTCFFRELDNLQLLARLLRLM